MEQLTIKDGQFGPYTVFSAGGDSYSAFGRFHNDFKRFKVGDDVNFQWEQKGNYKRVTNVGGSQGGASVTPPGNTPAPSMGQASPPATPGGLPNVGMMVSYAKDLMVGGVAGTVPEAVDIVRELVKEFSKPADAAEAAKEAL